MGDPRKSNPESGPSVYQSTTVYPGPGSTGMAAPNSSQGPGMPMSMAQPGLPTLAPAPPQQHQIQTSQIQQIHPGQPAPAAQQTMAGQPMTFQQGIGQPQFVIQQPAFAGGQQYTTFPQLAYTNQQGQLVLQPAPQFSIPGAAPGQPQGQQVILTNVQQKPGQPQMMVSTPGPTGKPGQPSYTITSSGPIQMQGGPPGSQPQTFMITNPMGPGIQGPVTMPAPNGQSPVLPTSMTNMKGADGKPVNCPPTQMAGAPNQQQFVIPSPGMTYMPAAGPPQIIQNGQQLIFRAPVPPEQQVMFSPSGQAPPQAPHQVQPPNSIPQGANNGVGAIQMPGPRAQTPAPPPPGKTAISRSIAPLPTSVAQIAPRPTLNQNVGQPSPKSKQKMSPRGTGNAGSRPPAPKGSQMKMMPRMSGVSGPVSMSGAPTLTQTAPTPIPRAQLPVQPVSQQQLITGPPTLSPMMVASEANGPVSMPVSLSTAQPVLAHPTLSTVPTLSTAVPVPAVTSNLASKPTDPSLDPPTLTKEIMTSMPNLGQPNMPGTRLAPMSKPEDSGETVTTPVISTPKAVVKPQVLTHVIDGHIIKESSQPFPVSPVKASTRRKSEKGDDAKQANGGVKRGPGRPPGSNNKSHEHKNGGLEPAEKKRKDDHAAVQGVPPSVPHVPHVVPPSSVAPTAPPHQPAPAPAPAPYPAPTQPVAPAPAPPPQAQAPLPQAPQVGQIPQQVTAPQPVTPPKPASTLLSSLKGNPLKWNVTEVCDFVKSLPGCAEYVDDFAQQEIDGQALMLLKADHLMSAMSIKLGPALKICSHIEQIREELAKL